MWGNGGTDPLIIDLYSKCRRVVNLMPWPLYPREKSPHYLPKKRLGLPQRWCGHFGEEKRFVGPLRNDTLISKLSSLWPSCFSNCTIRVQNLLFSSKVDQMKKKKMDRTFSMLG